MVWSRFINTQGRKGKNIPCDLHLEHLNRCLKDSLRNLHSNIKPKSVVRAAKAIGVVHHICNLFEKDITAKVSDHHAKPSTSKDFPSLLSELTYLKVFDIIPARDHESIHIKRRLFQTFNKKKYLDWVKNRIH